jgi:replicative DNA helicase
VLYFCLDQSKTDLYDYMLCGEAGVDDDTLRHGMDPKVQAALDRLEKQCYSRLRVVPWYHREKRFWEHMQSEYRDLREATRTSRTLLVIDYLQCLDPPDGLSVGASLDQYRVGELRHFQSFTFGREPILAISRVRKGDGPGKPLTIEDLSGDGCLGYAADNVLLLEASEPVGMDAKMVPGILRVTKSRHGTMSEIPLEFYYLFRRFREVPSAVGIGKARKKRGRESTPWSPIRTADPDD